MNGPSLKLPSVGLEAWAPVLAVCLLVVSACGTGERQASAPAKSGTQQTSRSSLREITLPDLSRMDAPVRTQARERYAAVMAKRSDASVSDAELGAAYGELAMLLHAAESYDAAEPAYLNAKALQPSDVRWPYYLAQLYKSEGQNDQAVAAFRRALEIDPNNVATLVWLGRMYIEQGDPGSAEPLFEKAASIPPRTVAPVAGLGQTALARRDYARAAQLLEEALAIDPRSASLHAPLAQAYRGLGDRAKAEAHAKQWRNTELPVVDPMMDTLKVSLESGLSFELQGVSALNNRDFTTAAGLFRKGVAMTTPDTLLGRSLRHKLGTALALSGDLDGAVRQFEEVTRLAPPEGFDEPAAKAHYSLGVLMAANNRGDDAIRHLTAAVRYNPNYVEARVALGDALRRAERVEPALTQYSEVVRMSPSNADARFGYAIGLVELGRWTEARDWLEESVRVQPQRMELVHALARILAAAPDARARDGQRAAALVQQIAQQVKTVDVAETMAMAMAEVGDFTNAVAIQRDLVAAARKAGAERDAQRLTRNLRLYERNQPCRMPWAPDDPVHLPGPRDGAS